MNFVLCYYVAVAAVYSVLRHRASAMKIARGPHSVGQHVLQYEDKCLLMRR